MFEDVDEISSAVSGVADPSVNLIFGLNFDKSLDDEIKVLLVATHKQVLLNCLEYKTYISPFEKGQAFLIN